MTTAIDMKPIQLPQPNEAAILHAIWDARKAVPSHDATHPLWIALSDVERLVTDHRVIMAYISETDQVHCAFCWEARQEDNHTDANPNDWLHATVPWCDNHHECSTCGTKDGNFND
jgi:hypothetical protein